jgi:uncharacterized protein YndB with AHSA1/START domain
MIGGDAAPLSANTPSRRSPSTPTADRELVIDRVFDAPRARSVFKAWTDSRHIAQWWGPNGFTTTVQSMDVRPGGVWRFVMHAPNGVDYDNTVVFREVVEPERLVYTHGSGDDGDDPAFEATVTFADEGSRTRLTLRQVYATAAQRDFVAREYHAVEMGHQTLNRFADYLASAFPPASRSGA